MAKEPPAKAPLQISGDGLRCQDVWDVASGKRRAALQGAAADRMAANAARLPAGPSVLERKRRWLLGEHASALPPEDLPQAFILDHCAGVGDPLPGDAVRAAMLCRANVLAVGLSGCRPDAARIMLAMIDRGVTPVVPSQGSVGAAGDLAPMAHIATVAIGATPGLPDDLPPLDPTPKEALSLINGVSVTAGMAALAVVRAHRVLDAAIVATAMTMETVGAHADCLDARGLEARLHPGPIAVAARMRTLLEGSNKVRRDRPPDAFSIRCAPTVLGAALEVIEQVEATVERELNGASDNPLLLDDGWLETGNFHGAALSMAMDQLKIAIVQIATLSERHSFRLTYGQLSPGLPSFLVPGTGLNSGFMLAQYTAASLTSEMKGLAHPASVDSIPTVQHHEDHVSMAPIAARMACKSLEAVADVVAIEALLAAQGLDLRIAGRFWDPETREERAIAPLVPAPAVEAARAAVRAVTPFWEDDGVLHPALMAVGALVREGGLS
jgi:histidine ammonia-lyase